MFVGGLGVVTSLGFGATDSFAAARAGLARTSELPIHNFGADDTWGGAPLVGHCVESIADGHVAMSKALALGRPALRDLLDNCRIESDEWKRTGVFVNVSDCFLLDRFASLSEDWNNYERAETPSQSWREQCRSLIPRLLEGLPPGPPPNEQYLYFGGHCGTAFALRDAMRALRANQFDRCLIGGIDSCVELHFLEAAAAAGMLKTAAFPVGFMPGEAAGFLLLEKGREPTARQEQQRTLRIGEEPVIAKDESDRFSEEPPNGRVLSDLVVRSQPSAAPVGLVIADLNGDVHRAADWGAAITQLQQDYELGDKPAWLTALSFGETGAATGILAIGMAARAVARSYAPPGSILIWLSSDNGDKAVLSVH